MEHGLHTLLAPMTAQSVHVTWLAHQYGGFMRGQAAPRTETRDHIEIARLGHFWFYPAMVGLFLRQWERQAQPTARFDFIVECVDGHILGAMAHTSMPVLPLVLRAPAGRGLKKLLHGPVAAVGEENARVLREAGALPPNVLTLPPFPPDLGDVDAWDRLRGSMLAALETFAALKEAFPPG